nr:truncated glutathione S-transferase M1 [Homo sapiens]AAT06766.1 truncated glutathione S-transferase M1 [Homo sapiens]
MPMILGYWDI